MKRIEEYDFTGKEVAKLPEWFAHSEFEKLVQVTEILFGKMSEFYKALSVFDEREMDPFFIQILSKFWGIPENTLLQQKLIDLLVLKLGLIKPSTLSTLYLISSLFFSTKNIYVQEERAEVYIHYAEGILMDWVLLVNNEGNFLVDISGNNFVGAIEDDKFNAFSLLSKTLAAGIKADFVEEKMVAVELIDDETNHLVEESDNQLVANIGEELSKSFEIRNLLQKSDSI